jgi:hypothetical protein
VTNHAKTMTSNSWVQDNVSKKKDEEKIVEAEK